MAKEEQAAAEAGAGGGGKKKMIIIIGAAVAVALILGVVAFMMLGKGDKKSAKEGDPAAQGAAPAAAGASAAGGHGAPAAGGAAGVPAANSFALDPFIVNIYDGQELRYLKVKVELQMVGPAVKNEIEANIAPIRDSIISLLTSKTLNDIKDAQGMNSLKDEILSAINKNIPPGKIAKVFLTDFLVQ